MGYTIKNYPEKSWSISKMKTIENCFREYYYTYYGSHNGWLDTSTDEQKISWRLKKLTNIWLMFGDKLHETIKKTIDNKHNLNTTPDYLKEYMRKILNKGVKESAEKYRDGSWDDYPRGEMLQEYYYGEKLDEESIDEIKRRIELCIDGFFNCKSYKDILKEKSVLLEVDEGKFDYIFVQGVKIFALIDMLYIDEDGYYVITDWKTGKVGEHDREQLLVYALYVMEKYNVTLDKIKGRVEYLLLGESADYLFNEEDLINIENRIKLDLNVIDAFLVDKELNKPRDKEDFRMCESLNKCRRCKFKKLCIS